MVAAGFDGSPTGSGYDWAVIAGGQPKKAVPDAHGCAANMHQAGMLTQEGQGGRPAALASRLYRIPTHFLLNLHGI